jgi:hypothetical protein
MVRTMVRTQVLSPLHLSACVSSRFCANVTTGTMIRTYYMCTTLISQKRLEVQALKYHGTRVRTMVLAS